MTSNENYFGKIYEEIFDLDKDADLAKETVSPWVIDEILHYAWQLEFTMFSHLPPALYISEELWKELLDSCDAVEERGEVNFWNYKDTEQLKRCIGIETINALEDLRFALVASTSDVDARKSMGRAIWRIGFIDGVATQHSGRRLLSDFSRKGAQATNAVFEEMKIPVHSWLDANFEKFKSVESIAKEIIKLEPISHRTAVKWVNEWKRIRGIK